MNRAEAKRQILGVFLGELSDDDEALFGPDGIEGERDYSAFDGARKELIAEFSRRTESKLQRKLRRLRRPL